MPVYNDTRNTTVTTYALIAVLSLALAGFFYVIGGPIFLSMLAALVVFAVLGVLHYALWGRSEQRAARVERRNLPGDPRTPPDYRG